MFFQLLPFKAATMDHLRHIFDLEEVFISDALLTQPSNFYLSSVAEFVLPQESNLGHAGESARSVSARPPGNVNNILEKYLY